MCSLNDDRHYLGDGPQCLQFPPEILMQVIGLLDKACDRRNARLVCKGFAEAGLPSLTYTVNLSIAGGLLDRVQAIAEHPVVRKYISKMVCSGTRLPSNVVSYDNFKNCYRPSMRQTELSVPLPVIYEQLVSRDDKKKKIIRRQRDQAVFLLALQRFVNLKRIVFTDVPLVEDIQDLARSQGPNVASGGDLWDPDSPYQILAVGFRSLYTQGTNLQQLKIVGSSYAIRDRIFSDASQTCHGHMRHVFGKLRSFELVAIVPEATVGDDPQALTYGALGGLLTRATPLETLKLASSYWPEEPPTEDDCPPSLDVATVLQGFTWPHLKHLGMRGFLMIGHEDLLGFFDRHRATLESVELMAVRILHHPDPQDTICEAWKHLFNGLRRRGINFQTLKLFILQDCYDLKGHFSQPDDPAYHGEKMLKYLHHGDINPLEPVLPIPDMVA
ncbi:MAG: hypothetical protein ASARMPRED_004503 [Alectoria sarmentosa]|nr:MAG: hypothetical protein ASARMPRED_004503 [Alectoria sarmentosa]